MLSGPSFRPNFVFCINSLILSSYPLRHYFICFFRGIILLCVQLSKNIMKCLLFMISHILVLILQSTCSICTTWKRKQTMEQERHRPCEWTKSEQKITSHSNWPRVLLVDLAHTQCNCIIKGWLQCLKSDSKGRFLVK